MRPSLRASSTASSVLFGTLLVLASTAGACGGSSIGVSDPDGGGGGGSDGGAGGGGDASGGGGGGGGPGGDCPATLPATRSACTTPGQACEYGGEGDELLCSVVVNCGQDHTWYSRASGGTTCVGSQAENPSACPSSFTALARGAACPSGFDSRCVYPEGMCGCRPCSGTDGGLTQAWSCEAWPDPAGCPEPRPRIGSACAKEGAECGYGSICSVLSGVPLLVCTDGVWKDSPIAADCALPKCGG